MFTHTITTLATFPLQLQFSPIITTTHEQCGGKPPIEVPIISDHQVTSFGSGYTTLTRKRGSFATVPEHLLITWAFFRGFIVKCSPVETDINIGRNC